MRHTRRAPARRSLAVITAVAVAVPLGLAASPASAATVAVLADFTTAPATFFSYGSAGFGVRTLAGSEPEARPGQVGDENVLSYGWNVEAAGSFGGVGDNFATARDFSAFDGLRLQVSGTGTGASFQVELFDGGANSDASERFDVTITDDVAGWREIELPWSAFTRATDFQPGGAPTDGVLDLTTVWGYALPAASGAATILVDDVVAYSDTDLAPTVSLASDAVSVIEAGTASVEVRLDIAPTAPVTVELATADGTATAGEDYTATTTTVEFAAGVTSRTVSIPTSDDALDEGSESFTASLSGATGAAIGAPASTTVTITDDDAPVVGPPTGRTLLVDDIEAPLTQGADGAVPVGWFPATDPSSSLSFEATTTPPSPVPGAADGNTVLAADFDISAFGVVVRSFANESLDEWVTQDWSTYEGVGFWMLGTGSGTDLFLDVQDNRNPGSAVDDAERYVVSFADDFVGWRFLTFDFSEFSRKNIGNGAPDDGLTLTEVHGYALGALRTDGPLTLHYDDLLLYGQAPERPLEVSFDRAAYEVVEGVEAPTVVRLNRLAETDVTVDYRAFSTPDRTRTEDLPATEGRDFAPGEGTVTIPAGEREAIIAVPTIDDGKAEVDETFVVELANPVGAEFGFTRTAAVSIQDDDTADADVIDDFEYGAGLLRSDAELSTRAAGSAYAGADSGETVLDVQHKGKTAVSRPIEQGQDWSGSEGISFWVDPAKGAKKVTVGIDANPAADPGPEGWELSWADEFEGAAGERANPENWTYETGGWGWGNDELQYYTDSTDNAALDGEGNLRITAREIEPSVDGPQCWYGPCTHTSARLITEGKQEFQYGRIETRVFVPEGSGIWPAVWTLGNDFRDVGWPQTGEIDVMEFVGRLPNEIFGTIHGPGYSGGQSFGGIYDFGTPVPADWHTFETVWTEDSIDWYVDGIQYHSASPEDVAPNEWVFDHPFTLLTNVAVGGNFGGAPGADLVFPQSLLVDYIRVYQAPDTAEKWVATVPVSGEGWQQVTVPFSAFAPAKDARRGPATAGGLVPADVRGWSLELKGAGTTSIDRVALEAEVDARPSGNGQGGNGPGAVGPGTAGPGGGPGGSEGEWRGRGRGPLG
ncbi:family 16 glycosylhydrolase [Microcella daejeonensis]|uniref:carbohydrate binding domain-containing protein n=1 Tax=Microcella daejeonensis TaxID=2994971 RepID=UPI00226E702A|nr:carbohydrate binding domain-containing protein [Microcella daejeonensis]WAB84338.1 family 16 glycosylhydrolase [Microcella daejeonensis]